MGPEETWLIISVLISKSCTTHVDNIYEETFKIKHTSSLIGNKPLIILITVKVHFSNGE